MRNPRSVGRANGGAEQVAARRLLKLLFHTRDERRAFLQKVAACLSCRGIELLDRASRSHRSLEVLAHEIEPVLAGGALQLGGVRTEGGFELLLVLDDDRGDFQIAAHGVDG